jgi:hypothetical protein
MAASDACGAMKEGYMLALGGACGDNSWYVAIIPAEEVAASMSVA